MTPGQLGGVWYLKDHSGTHGTPSRMASTTRSMLLEQKYLGATHLEIKFTRKSKLAGTWTQERVSLDY